MYYNKDKKVIVSKSFKTASSSFYCFLKRNARIGEFALMNQHLTLKQIINKFNLNKNKVIKIVQVRNPWDYVVSSYYWAKDQKKCPQGYTFEDFIFKPSKFNWQKQLDFWDLNYIDNFIKYEHLENDIKAFCQTHDFSYDYLSKEKGGIRPQISYIEVHTPKTKEYIQEIFKNQIKTFNYEY